VFAAAFSGYYLALFLILCWILSGADSQRRVDLPLEHWRNDRQYHRQSDSNHCVLRHWYKFTRLLKNSFPDGNSQSAIDSIDQPFFTDNLCGIFHNTNSQWSIELSVEYGGHFGINHRKSGFDHKLFRYRD